MTKNGFFEIGLKLIAIHYFVEFAQSMRGPLNFLIMGTSVVYVNLFQKLFVQFVSPAIYLFAAIFIWQYASSINNKYRTKNSGQDGGAPIDNSLEYLSTGLILIGIFYIIKASSSIAKGILGLFLGRSFLIFLIDNVNYIIIGVLCVVLIRGNESLARIFLKQKAS